MQIKYLEEMKKGWFAGDFSPTALKTDFGEIAIKRYGRYHIESAYCHPNATVMYLLISGSIALNGKVLCQPYSMAVFTPGEQVYFSALSDCAVMLFVSGSKEFTRGKGIILDDLCQAYSCFNEFGENRELSINPKDLTFVVQGGISELTPICLESVRRFFPQSTIILSTEYERPIQNLDYDILVQNEDVGSFTFKRYDTPNSPQDNINRQIISTINGLKQVNTKYTMKIRTDMILTGRRFASYLHDYPNRIDQLRLFNERVIVSEYWTRKRSQIFHKIDGYQSVPRLFQVSDCFFFGLTEDLRTYFYNTQFLTEDEVNNTSVKNDILRTFNKYDRNHRYTGEQHLALEALARKFPDIKKKYQDWSDWSEENQKLSDMFIGNNFIILDLPHHGITMPKHEMRITDQNTGRGREHGFFTQQMFERYYYNVIMNNA